MSLLTVRNNLKKQYKDYVIFIRYGNFYRVFDEDTYIVWFYTCYKINNKRLGFPITEITKILDYISSKVNIIICDNGDIKILPNTTNNYNNILFLAKNEYKKYTILNKLKDCDCLNDIEIIGNKYGINYNN